MRNLRRWILGSVMGSGLLLVASGYLAGMGAVLFQLGDTAGANAVLGAAGVSAAGFAIAHILLVMLLALAVLQRSMDSEAIAE